ncbi:DNA mistmatch repair protein MutT [Vibrio parahaemolyticus M0605]|nr:DNA mistmatch repair protein MutT [Vibrio parahaemolyticus M0605]
MIDKVCPVVLRKKNQEILLFQHPLAGIQLVKGTVETFDESYITAAKRELAEESGIAHIISARYLGSWDSGFQNQAWHFVLCECADLADS